MRLDLDTYTTAELWSWVEAYLGDVDALTELIIMLGDTKDALDCLLSQDVYSDYEGGCVLAWWLKGASAYEAVQHLDLVGFDANNCVYHLVRNLNLDVENDLAC